MAMSAVDQLVQAAPGIWGGAAPGQYHAGFQHADAGEQAAIGGDDPGKKIVRIRFAAQDRHQDRRIQHDYAGRP
ncbi:hypothetical protein [Gluconacetobacter takamatsuzukensis]|uniref:hypothetical protein n=1 Tax=Gluconacetobacter takamatsuzukensis TaxID=1286190 RepID=UPI003084072D